MVFNILGAGVSGLTTAINLAKQNKNVHIHELRSFTGKRFEPNYQGLFGVNNIQHFFKNVNLDINFDFITMRYIRFIWENHDDIVIDLDPGKAIFIKRGGGSDSIEEGLYEQALNCDVKINFKSKMREDEVDIVASGPKITNGVALGKEFEKSENCNDKEMIIFFNKKYSPKGYYMYGIPNKNSMEIFNVCSARYSRNLEFLYNRGIKHFQPYFRGNPKRCIIGRGNFTNPKTAFFDGRFYIGEAAGFQDPFMGFGNNYSIRSAFLCAKSILEGLNYDFLWKNEFKLSFNRSLALRFLSSTFEDRFIYQFVKTYQKNKVKSRSVQMEFSKLNYLILPILIKIFSTAEVYKKSLVGHW